MFQFLEYFFFYFHKMETNYYDNIKHIFFFVIYYVHFYYKLVTILYNYNIIKKSKNKNKNGKIRTFNGYFGNNCFTLKLRF
jgi:hypothetical protein